MPPPRILPSIEKGGGDNDNINTSDEDDDDAHSDGTDNNDVDDAAENGDDYGYSSDSADPSHDDMDEEELSDVHDGASDDLARAEKSASIAQPQFAALTPPKRRPLGKSALSPQQLHTRAKASHWQSGKTYNPVSETPHPRSFGMSSRPYLSAWERQQTISGIKKATVSSVRSLPSYPFHVDFSDVEVYYLQQLARKV